MNAALAAYPNMPTPPPPPRSEGSANPVTRASRLLAQGRPGAAGRALASDMPLAPPGPETDAALDELHPVGDPHPFSGINLPPSRRTALSFSDDDLLSVFRSFDRGTASGPDGWNPALVELVIDDEDFRTALRTLFSLMITGKAPCKDLLCASTLIPLQKLGGKIRPIAVGTFFYRLVTKAVLRARSLQPSLLPYQFGVGSPGGVEPVLFWLEHILKNSPPDSPLHIASLDFRNAFNTLSRTAVARAVLTHAPHLFFLVQWSYGSPSPLLSISADPAKPTLRWSSQGVRQGDPLGPGLFSLAIRDVLEGLSSHLGPSHNVAAYLDDINVVCPDAEVVDKVRAYLESSGCSLVLNVDKCRVNSVSEIRELGLDVLGSVIGPLQARRAFLSSKIDGIRSKLLALNSLTRQEAYIILRSCYQLDLAHLLRSLDPDGLDDLWTELDDLLLATFRTLRGPAMPPFLLSTDEEIESTLVCLPLRMGGFGILSHAERSPLARAAAMSSAHHTLSPFVPSIEPPTDLTSQRDRHRTVLHERQRDCLRKLTPLQQARVLESSSLVGRSWLTAFPSTPQLVFPDAVFSLALHYRALAEPTISVCPLCHQSSDKVRFGHEDNCSALQPARTSRHEQIKMAIMRLLSTVPGVKTYREPAIIGRDGVYNDVRVAAAPGSLFPACDLDITVPSLSQVRNAFTIGSSRGESHLPDPLRDEPDDNPEDGDAAPADLFAAVRRRAQKALGRAADTKIKKQGVPPHPSAPRFAPFVLSAGGLLHDSTTALLQRWRPHLPATIYGRLIRLLSASLLFSRVPRQDDLVASFRPALAPTLGG